MHLGSEVTFVSACATSPAPKSVTAPSLSAARRCLCRGTCPSHAMSQMLQGCCSQPGASPAPGSHQNGPGLPAPAGCREGLAHTQLQQSISVRFEQTQSQGARLAVPPSADRTGATSYIHQPPLGLHHIPADGRGGHCPQGCPAGASCIPMAPGACATLAPWPRSESRCVQDPFHTGAASGAASSQLQRLPLHLETLLTLNCF